MPGWKRNEKVAFLRAVDAAAAIMVSPAGRGPTGRLVTERLLASAFGLLVPGGDPLEESERAAIRLAALAFGDRVDEATARSWMREVLRDRAREANRDARQGDWDWIDPREHDAWKMLDLTPFPRRLQVWTATTKVGAAALGSKIGVGAHQIGHWAAGRSKPSAAHRVALAAALGVHESWFGAERDYSADTDLYLYRACPCASGAALELGSAERSAHRSSQTDDVPVQWCGGCAQPYAVIGASGLIPLPLAQDTEPPHRHQDRWLAHTRSTLDRPWPIALWCPGSTLQAGPVSIPALLTVPPFTPPVPAAPAADNPPAGRVHRQPLSGGPEPQSGIHRSGVERLQALMRWVGQGRRLTDKGQLKLADARMLVEALPTSDHWDPVEYGHLIRTRSSTSLPHLQRLLAWSAASGVLHVVDAVLAPTGDHTTLIDDLPALAATLTAALPTMALRELNQYWALSPLSEQDELGPALAVLWRVLRNSPRPISPLAIADAIYDYLTDGGQDPFQEPADAERAVRRDVSHLLVLLQDLDLVAAAGDHVQLTAAGRRAATGQTP